MILTFKYRVKDASKAAKLTAHARTVNEAWNSLVLSEWVRRGHYAEIGPNLPGGHRFNCAKRFVGRSKEIGLHSDTLSEICRVFTNSRDTHKRCPKARGRKSLGWIPFVGRSVKIAGGTIRYVGVNYRVWLSRPFPLKIKTGAFVQDARGRWYVCVTAEVASVKGEGIGAVGIDLGLKDFAALSNGTTLENPRWFRALEDRLAVAQRARQPRRVKAIHAKIANRRNHVLHQYSTRLVRQFEKIVVGSVSASSLGKTSMAKSVYDAGWSAFRTMLRYKCQQAQAVFEEADERFSTQTCSACSARSGPKGLKGLRIRQWRCESCLVLHHRDTNAASNLLAGAERRPLAEGISGLDGGEDVTFIPSWTMSTAP
jgi:transposase